MTLHTLCLSPAPGLSDFPDLMCKPDVWPARINTADRAVTGFLPRWVIVSLRDGSLLKQVRQPDLSYIATPLSGSLPSALRDAMSDLPKSDGQQGFQGGVIGWIAYDHASQHAVADCVEQLSMPTACLAGYDIFLRPEVDKDAVYKLSAPTATLLHQAHQLLAKTDDAEAFQLESRFIHLMSPSEYRNAFDRVHDYLLAGDCYQVNLAQGFRAACHGPSWPAFSHLHSASRPPYAAFMATPYGDVLSLSPELFLEFTPDKVITRPIKGTRPRGHDLIEDEKLRQDLASHPKDRAENLMIVDLLRNDLSRHAQIGSVSAHPLFQTQTFRHVHHLVSEVSCRLKEDSHPLDLLFDAFPGGSITGAPKKRAQEIIHELENCERSVYCGSIGYMTPEGWGEWNIAIRTLVRQGNRIHAWAGGGIVADSHWEAEYQECFNKIGPMLNALESNFLAPASIPDPVAGTEGAS